ncbi:cytochrome P450 2K1 isoform X2 [Bombina bombina]|uniref:cytochrome P450 2K1 isoform X2 n=1 Tax=Bombina bombina TaxID=8345 RepID=UPI00235B0857|nr:cytochrome P450 2K1 isoform X2 [Bombina bombina]
MMLLIYITICVVLLFYLVNHFKKTGMKMHPGPRPLPFIGNLHLLDLKKPYQSLMEMSETYGDVFTVHFGPMKMVVLSGYKTVKDALVNQADDFGDRADMPIFTNLIKGNGIVFGHGESWKIMRRFTLSTLRDFGMGKKTIQSRIQDELHPLLTHLESYNGKPFGTPVILNSAVSNVISSIIFGKRFEYDDPTLISLIKLINQNTKLSGTPQAMESSNLNTYFHYGNLTYSALDLLAAGTETTSTTLSWALLLMTKYPEIQKKVQEEIKTFIKPGQLPKVDDRKNMPYTDAVVHEVQRFANIVPLNLSHVTTKDVHFRGYHIPKGIEVIPMLTSVLYDKTQWDTPYRFNPHHFLDADGKFVKKDAFIPFSAGRRACVGESLAKMEIFLFFTGLLQKFTFHPPPGISEDDLSLDADIGFVLWPVPYKTCAVSNY